MSKFIKFSLGLLTCITIILLYHYAWDFQPQTNCWAGKIAALLTGIVTNFAAYDLWRKK